MKYLFYFTFSSRVGMNQYVPSPLGSRVSSQESLRHFSTMGSMNMLQTPTSSVSRDGMVAVVQKKKGIKSSLGRFFSKKEKVKGVKDSMPDGSASMMSIGNISMMSDIDSNYDSMSLLGGKLSQMPSLTGIPSKLASAGSVDYGRQKK